MAEEHEVVRRSRDEIERQLETLRGLDSDELQRQLHEALRLTVEQVTKMAAIIRVLHERGFDLSELKLGLVKHLQKIAYGRLLPELFVRYQEYPLLVQRLEALGPDDQQRLIEAGEVELAQSEDADEDEPIRKPLDRLGQKEIWQVFADGEVRSLAKQREVIRARNSRKRAQAKGKGEEGVKIDTSRGGIEVNGVFLSRRDLTNYLLELEQRK